MKNWFRFFFLGFFSDKISREGARRGYTNVFLGLLLAFAFIWLALTGADMLPFSVRYGNSPDFRETAYAVFANSDAEKRINVKIEDGTLKAARHGGEYTPSLLVNTYENDTDRESYSVNRYNVVVDTRPADTLAEVVAYCLSNDGEELRISYEEYLTLSDVARLNFDFKLSYTGAELCLTDEAVAGYTAYLDGLSEGKPKADSLAQDLTDGKITKTEYNREIYKLYFTNYYPEITDYESSSKVPLLRNYYYHEYINQGATNYLFVFDDCMTGSFETKRGVEVSFYGFYDGKADGVLVSDGVLSNEANASVDKFIKNSFRAGGVLNLYAHAMNVMSLIPFIALMPMVVTLLAYSLLKLRGVDSIPTLGGAFKIIGAYVWFSALVSAVLTVIIAFLVKPGALTALPLVLFFVTLAIRAVIFTINEGKAYFEKQKQKDTEQTEA